MNDFGSTVGYFSIESLTGIFSETDVKITDITFDGAPANITLLSLGADIDNPPGNT